MHLSADVWPIRRCVESHAGRPSGRNNHSRKESLQISRSAWSDEPCSAKVEGQASATVLCGGQSQLKGLRELVVGLRSTELGTVKSYAHGEKQQNARLKR